MREEQLLPKEVDVRGTALSRPRAGRVEAKGEEDVIRSRHETLRQREEGKDIPALPGCDAGAAGRTGFVLRELGHLLPRWRDRKPAGYPGMRDRGGTR